MKLQGIWPFSPYRRDKCRICLVDKFGIYHGRGRRLRPPAGGPGRGSGAPPAPHSLPLPSKPLILQKQTERLSDVRSVLAGEEGFEFAPVPKPQLNRYNPTEQNSLFSSAFRIIIILFVARSKSKINFDLGKNLGKLPHSGETFFWKKEADGLWNRRPSLYHIGNLCQYSLFKVHRLRIVRMTSTISESETRSSMSSPICRIWSSRA